MSISEDRAVELALGSEPPGSVVDYGGGWLIWRAQLEGRIGDGATLVDRDGQIRAVRSFEIGDLLGVIADHHGMTREEARDRFPPSRGFDGYGPEPTSRTTWV